MCSTSIFSCITTRISNFIIFFVFRIIIVKLFFTNITEFAFSYGFSCSFVNNFIFIFLKLIIFIVCCLEYSQNVFVKSLPLHTSCLFSIPLNEDTDFEKSDRISFAFLQMKFQDYFYIQQSCLLYIQDLHKSQMMLYKIFDIDILNPNILVSS